MSRSVWKGPFVDDYLIKKAEAVKSSGRNDVIKTWSRRSTILPEFVGLTFGVHNGKKHIPVTEVRTWLVTNLENFPRPELIKGIMPIRKHHRKF